MNLPDYVTISIATKDRGEVLDRTLNKIHEFGLGECPLIIYDDGTDPALQPAALKLFPNTTLLRSHQASGQAIARNKIIDEARTPYVLQLDDDSYPIVGSVERLIHQLQHTNHCFAAALKLEEPLRGRNFYNQAPDDQLIPVQSFIGCAVFIHRQRFLEIGGYADWIGRTVEEEELCLRALSLGYEVLFSQAIGIRHDVTDQGRDLSGILQRSVRNWTALYIRHAPFADMVCKLIRMLLFSAFEDLKRMKLRALGCFCSSLFSKANWSVRLAVEPHVFKRFTHRRHALSFFRREG